MNLMTNTIHTSVFRSTTTGLYSRLRTCPSFRRLEVLTIFPIEDGVWELFLSARYVWEFRNCAEDFGFAIEPNSNPKHGFSLRALILWLESVQDCVLSLAASSYIRVLQMYLERGAYFQLPSSCDGVQTLSSKV